MTSFESVVNYDRQHVFIADNDDAGFSPALGCGTDTYTQPRSMAPGQFCSWAVF